MIVHPLIGIGEIILGSTQSEIIEVIGEPDSTDIKEWPYIQKEESWHFHNMKLDLSFDSENKFRLSSITVFSRKATLDGFNLVGVSEKELTERFPSIILDEDFEENGRNLIYPKKEISFWLVDNMVVNFTIFPEYDDTGEHVLWPNHTANNTN